MKFSLSFKVEDNGTVDIDSKKYKILELFRDYGFLVQYAYGTHVKRQMMYYPATKTLKEKIYFGKWENTSLDLRMIKWRTVKVKKEFITGQELESVLMSSKGVVDYRDKGHYIELIGMKEDGEEFVVQTIQVDKETGKLK
jgi:hypothetical protein